jgi:hypothetical protein
MEVRMNKALLAAVAALMIAGSTAVVAQHRPWFQSQSRFSPEDRAAFTDARIAAVKAGLKLNPDQERLWPALESAVRDFARLRMERANARMNASRDDRRDDARDMQKSDDPVARLREHADTMGTTAAALKRIADAADPLYKTLDDGQKRRLAILTHMRRFGGGEGRRQEFWRDRDDGGDRNGDWSRGDRGGERGRGFERDRGPEREAPRGGAERL